MEEGKLFLSVEGLRSSLGFLTRGPRLCSYSLDRSLFFNSFQGHPTNLFLTLSVPHRNLAGWQNIRCSNELAGKFLIVRGFGWELLTFLAFQAELAEKLGNLRTTTTTLSTTTGSEIPCTAQARSASFVVVVSSTTSNRVESRRPAIHKLQQV